MNNLSLWRYKKDTNLLIFNTFRDLLLKKEKEKINRENKKLILKNKVFLIEKKNLNKNNLNFL